MQYFTENISIKIVEELEDWKEKQQEMFLAEVNIFPICHLLNKL